MAVTCTDGTTADSLEECPQLIDYEQDVGYEAEGQFITDDPDTPVDESMRDIYQAIGGADWTDQTLDEFTAMYQGDFPTWAGSESELKSDLIESKLGMLPELMDLSKRSSQLESETTKLSALTEMEETRKSRESMIRAGGGLKTGQSKDKIESTYDRVLSGFDLQQDGIDIKRESSLFDFEGRRLDYQMDLSSVKQDFQDRMWDLIGANIDKYKGAGDSTCVGEVDACGTCNGGVTDSSQCGGGGESQVDSGEQVEQGWDPSDTGQGEGPGGDDLEQFDYSEIEEGFGEDYDYEDWGDLWDGEYS